MNENLQTVCDVLKNGGISIFPTDTAFGIGCRIDNEESVRRLFKIRRRLENKPMLALVDSIEMAEKYLKPISFDVRNLMKQYWPGGLTIIFPCDKNKVLLQVRGGGETLGVRMPKHDILLELIKQVGVPILAPSANFSGGTTPLRLEEVEKELIDQVDAVLTGECTYKGQSTVIDCSVNPWNILREGVVTIDL